ncbi:MAG: DoxX family protein [Salinivirgaceae bacterium]|nr:MAG: DoxX family protein [Salinivirgaceae bacterium]
MGINHFVMIDFYAGMLTSFMPGGGFTIILVGILLLAASISILTRKFVQISSYLLAGLLFLFIVTIHIPHLIDPGELDIQLVVFSMVKDVALMGGSLMIAGACESKKKLEE